MTGDVNLLSMDVAISGIALACLVCPYEHEVSIGESCHADTALVSGSNCDSQGFIPTHYAAGVKMLCIDIGVVVESVNISHHHAAQSIGEHGVLNFVAGAVGNRDPVYSPKRIAGS